MRKHKILSIDHLNFHHNGRKKVLSDFSLDVYAGDRIGIIGPNGTGKTTLFLLLSGIFQPVSGEIILWDQKVVKGEFRPELGMVFQDQDDQVFCPTVWDDIAFGPQNMDLSREEVEKRVKEAAETLGISSLLARPPHQLSGGEKRLVAIAGILAMKSKFVIFDEPTSNLDMRYRRKLIQFLSENAPQEGMMIASHDLEFILEVCNRVVLMDEGKVIADGIPEKILSNESLLPEHGMECPYSLKQKKLIPSNKDSN